MKRFGGKGLFRRIPVEHVLSCWVDICQNEEVWRKGIVLNDTGWTCSLLLGSYTVESGKNVTFFEQLFCFYQLVLVVWNTLGAKFKLSFISRVEQNCHFLWQWSKKLLLTIWGDFGGKRGSGKNHFSARGFRGLARLASFYSISVPRTGTEWAIVVMTNMANTGKNCTRVYSFFRCSPCLSWQRWLIRYPVTLTPVSQVTSIKAGWAHFLCLPIVWFFRQAHKHPTKPNDQFLEILTCWTRWQASFFINLKGKTSKPAKMKGSFTKIFEAKKNWQK